MSEVTKDTKAEAPVKKIKIKLLRDAKVNGKIMPPGTICEVDEKTATLLCDKKYKGYHPFYGNKPEIAHLNDGVDLLDRKAITRAVRIA